MRHSTAPVRVSILVISLRLRNETIRLPSLSRSSELPCIQLTLGPVRLAGAKSVISKWSNGFHWNNSSPTELTCWTTVPITCAFATPPSPERSMVDRKSTRLNSSHGYISYAVFCLKKKNTYEIQTQ